jgi:hypothetical protein
VRLVHAHLVADHVARCIAQEVASDALVRGFDALLRRGPGLLAFVVSVAQALEHAALEEVQEVLLRLRVVPLEALDRAVDVADRSCVERAGKLEVVAAHGGAAGD